MSIQVWTTQVSHTQAKYKAFRKKTSGGGQSSYNLKDHDAILRTFLKDGIFEEVSKLLGDKNKPNNYEITYRISSDYTLKLDKKIINLIGQENITLPINLHFSNTSIEDANGHITNKLQIKRAINNTDSTVWFQKLYDVNTENSEFIVKYNSIDKEINIDINTILPRETLMNNETIYKNTSYRNKPSYQKIYYGVPGTGKSYQITQDIKKWYSSYPSVNEDNVIRTTIHPEYSYHDFIGTVMPIVYDGDDGRTITYDFKPGPFTIALKQALMEENKLNPIFLVIEEMSRGDIAAIFGDIFQLLDRKNGVSEYGIRNSLIAEYIFGDPDMTIKLPINFNILGTLNTSDQNVYIMDNAFQRRFKFVYVSTSPVKDKNNTKYLNDYHFKLGNKEISWIDFYVKFNKFVVEKMNLLEDKQIGQFFLKFDDESNDEERYELIIYKLLKYIWSDIHGNATNGKDIVSDKINSFEGALLKLKRHDNVFCEEFYNELSNYSANQEG